MPRTLALAAGLSLIAAAALGLRPAEPPSAAQAQAPTPASRAALAPCAPLIGHWRGQLGGTTIEEVWMPAAGNNITGALRWFDADGAVRMYELFSIDADNNNGADSDATAPPVRMTLRHFHPGLVPWAAETDAGPMLFQLDPAYDTGLAFNTLQPERGVRRIVYTFPAPDRMTAAVEFPEAEARPAVQIHFQRVAPEG